MALLRTRAGLLCVSCLLVGCVGSGLRAADCNNNGVEDAEDLTAATSDDCNNNGVPDECESAADCNGNGVADLCELADDCNDNGVPDECETAPMPFPRVERLVIDGLPGDVRTADFNADGRVDLAVAAPRVVDDAGVAHPAVVSIFVAEEGYDVRSYERRDVPLDSNSKRWVVGDFDGDGDADLARLDEPAVLVALNQGDATFAAAVASPLIAKAVALAAGDMNGDGRDDLVASSNGTDTVAVALSAGEGTLQAPIEYPAGDYPRVILVDLDSDGDLDAAAANSSSADVSVFLNDGSGALSTAGTYPSGDISPRTIQAEDLDADGLPDIVLGNSTSVGVLRNLGDGAFGEAQLTLSGSRRSNALVTGDIDRDGDVDVLGSYGRPRNVYAFLNDGSGRFGAVSIARLEIDVSALLLDDMDDDGDVDLLLAPTQQEQLHVARNDPNAGSDAFSFEEGVPLSVLGDPHTLTLGDVEGDGDLDMITGNNNAGISILLNHGDGTFGEPMNTPSNFDGVISPVGWSFSMDSGDIDGVLGLDVISADVSAAQVQLFLNIQNGLLEPINLKVGGSPFHIILAELNGDDALDIVSAQESSNRLSLLFNDGSGGFGLATDVNVGTLPRCTAVGDLDGDGDTDLAAANFGSSDLTLLRNDGNGGFSPWTTIPLVAVPNFIVADDLDRDGHVDLYVGNDADAVGVLWNTGDGTFQAPATFLVHSMPYTMVSADLNTDGFPDIVTLSEIASEVSVLSNNGDRTFLLGGVPIEVGANPRYVVSGDLDGDGDPDVVSGDRRAFRATVLINNTSDRQEESFLEEICTAAEFHSLSVPGRGGNRPERITKYVLPARESADLLPTLYQNSRLFSLHEDFLRENFPDRFPTLDPEEYIQIVGRRATRDYFVGFINRVTDDEDFVYAFTIVADTGLDPTEVLSLEEVSGVFQTLSETFHLTPLAYQPLTELDRTEAESWGARPFPLYFDDGSTALVFEPYTLATGYGRVRLLTLEEFETDNQKGLFTFQDLLVIDQAPRDIEGVVGGVITGALQGPLSHVAIRTARRGTPNAYVAEAHEVFRPFEGKLVRLEVFDTEYFVEPVPVEEAEAFWASNRPTLGRDPTFDAAYPALDGLLEMDLVSTGENSPVSRYGGKASNMSRLQHVLTGEYEGYRERGFAIPMKYYLDFMRTNTLDVDGVQVTYETYLLELLDSEAVQTDSARRFTVLDEFRQEARSNGTVPPELVAQLAERIEQVFGNTTTMVRFRSSSNVEDTLVFNGAGLYESTSVCVADTLDPSDADSSFCDPSRTNERTIERALKKVWTSLWTFRAHEERTFFQIPSDLATMGLLVNRAFLDETSNGVAFTGNPRDARDKRYVITAQVGEESVVSPEPGTSVERNLLQVVDGEVVEIIRNRSSSLVEAGQVVVSDEKLRELGNLMWFVEQNLPVDREGRDPTEILLDFEFKTEPDGNLAVKQVRPFLIPSTTPTSPTFELEVPAGLELCAVFSEERVGRPPQIEYDTKSRLRLIGGTIEMPTSGESFSADLFEELVVGPERLIAEPVGSGLFELQKLATDGSETLYRFSYEQQFQLPNGDAYEIRIARLDYRGRGSSPVEKTLVLDEAFNTDELTFQGVLNGTPQSSYSSCSHEVLPLWHIGASFEGGSLTLEERFRPSPDERSTGPASLRVATVELGDTRQTITDYWQLVYASQRHNRRVRYWVILDEPINVAGVEAPVHALELEAPEPPEFPVGRVSYLDSDFVPTTVLDATMFEKNRGADMVVGSFRRGDVNADGRINVVDAVTFLDFLFRHGAVPSCLRALDADDNGRLQIVDVIRMVQFSLARGAELPPPTGTCGTDPTADDLSCESFGGCP
jgi:hypothetical protein